MKPCNKIFRITNYSLIQFQKLHLLYRDNYYRVSTEARQLTSHSTDLLRSYCQLASRNSPLFFEPRSSLSSAQIPPGHLAQRQDNPVYINPSYFFPTDSECKTCLKTLKSRIALSFRGIPPEQHRNGVSY